jgi:hypothetical protein
MIVKNERESALECTLCGELEGVSPRALVNEAALMILMDRVSRDHLDCAEWEHDPARARVERQFKVRMRAEMRSIA